MMTFTEATGRTTAPAAGCRGADAVTALADVPPRADAARRTPAGPFAFPGVVSGDDVARLLESRGCGDYVSLARLITRNQLLAVRWHDDYWVPMFQFDLQDFSVRRGVAEVLDELAPVLEPQELLAWFATSNASLGDRCPQDVVADDPAAVIAASRADRLVRCA